jgi:hypothetical protein
MCCVLRVKLPVSKICFAKIVKFLIDKNFHVSPSNGWVPSQRMSLYVGPAEGQGCDVDIFTTLRKKIDENIPNTINNECNNYKTTHVLLSVEDVATKS